MVSALESNATPDTDRSLVVLRGRPTLRTGDGSRELAEADAVHFPRGPDGAHGLASETDEPVRLLMASTLVSPEVAEYPDHKQITVQARRAPMRWSQPVVSPFIDSER